MKKIERIYRLEVLLELANFDFTSCEESDFLTLIRNYSNLLADFNDDFPFISPSERFSLYMEGLSVFEDTGALHEKKKYFMGIQRHLLSRLYVQIPTSHEKYPVSDNQKLKDINHIEINGVLSVSLKGAWNSRRFVGGGPFWCYFVPDVERGRIYCVDLLVFAPGMEKMNFFRRMSAVASTFSLKGPQS